MDDAIKLLHPILFGRRGKAVQIKSNILRFSGFVWHDNQATVTDILKKLARQFDTDLTPRKSSMKLMIQEELTKLADEDGDSNADKDENQSAEQGVET